MSNLLKNVIKGSLLTVCVFAPQTPSAQAACSTNCATLGYVMDQNKCDPASILKCPFDNTKVYCKEKSCEDSGQKTCNGKCIATTACCTNNDCGVVGTYCNSEHKCVSKQYCNNLENVNTELPKVFNTALLFSDKREPWTYKQELVNGSYQPSYIYSAGICNDNGGVVSYDCHTVHWEAYYLGRVLEDACIIVSDATLRSKYVFAGHENDYNQAKCQDLVWQFNDIVVGRTECSYQLSLNRKVSDPEGHYISERGMISPAFCSKCTK